ncbi:MAG: hypothetical protein GX495_00700 [Chloroflexi bacterium]|jgi:chromosome segregation ATPase|nr:hypothetical protein [Chloroflexota bacterium]
MSPWINRIAGIILTITAVIGLLFCLAAIALVWRFKTTAAEQLIKDLSAAGGALDITAQGLIVADQSLNESIASLEGLKITVDDTASTIRETTPLVETLADLMGEDVPTALESVKTSLDAAQESARIIDGMLSALSFLPGVNYDPPVPLNEALADVSDSIAELPESFAAMEESLDNASSRAGEVERDIRRIADDIDEISRNLEDARKVIGDYAALVTDLQTRFERFETSLPAIVNSGAMILTFLLVWAAVAQVGMFLQGVALLQNRTAVPAPAQPVREDLLS